MLAFLVLQQAAGAAAAATPADSAFAHDALRRGLAELAAAGATSDQRYSDQLQVWGMVDEAWRLVADRAAREAGALRDPAARNVAYLELTERAVAGGRLAAAADFADRTAGGKPRVRARLAVASAEWESGREAAARDRLARTLPLLDPTWSCEGHCVVASPLGSPPAAPRGMNCYLILEFVLLALRADLRDELVDWAASQPDAGGRAAAWIVLAEATTKLRLGRIVAYPMH